MKIIFNGREESLPLNGETLEDLLSHFLKLKYLEISSIKQLKLNGEDIPMDLGEYGQTPLLQIETLEIGTFSIDEIVTRSITNAGLYLENLIPEIEKVADLFRSGNEQEANRSFVKIIDAIDLFSQVVDTLVQALSLNIRSPLFNGLSIQDRLDNLTQLINQMVEANKNRDWVFLADLLEYEILPYYSEWIDILPRLARAEKNPSG